MEKVVQGFYVGERACYNSKDIEFFDTTFGDGESHLKESKNIILNNCIFKWKYPLWYCKDVVLNNTTLLDTARSGIWYTKNVTINDSMIQAPKQFRRSSNITLNNVVFGDALETLWNCNDVTLNNVVVKGNYFCFNTNNIKADKLLIDGNYAFDGSKNIEVTNSKIISKDSFWNSENVVVKDSLIIGEYLGWNSKNLTFINCTLESLQGMCYIEGLTLINCKMLNCNLSFELCSDVKADVTSVVDSIKNPISGEIKVKDVKEIIMDETLIDPSKTKITKGN